MNLLLLLGAHVGLVLGGAEKHFTTIQTVIHNTATLKVHGEYKVVDQNTGTVLDDEQYVVVENQTYTTNAAVFTGDPVITLTWITGPNYVNMGFTALAPDGTSLPCQSLSGYNGSLGPINAGPHGPGQWTMTFKPSCP